MTVASGYTLTHLLIHVQCEILILVYFIRNIDNRICYLKMIAINMINACILSGIEDLILYFINGKIWYRTTCMWWYWIYLKITCTIVKYFGILFINKHYSNWNLTPIEAVEIYFFICKLIKIAIYHWPDHMPSAMAQTGVLSLPNSWHYQCHHIMYWVLFGG